VSDGHLTSYADLAQVLDNLPLLLREARRSRGLSLRAAAKQMPGVTFNTLTRIENGAGHNVKSAAAVLRWLDSRWLPEGDDRD